MLSPLHPFPATHLSPKIRGWGRAGEVVVFMGRRREVVGGGSCSGWSFFSETELTSEEE